jgi:hypothetical protein
MPGTSSVEMVGNYSRLKFFAGKCGVIPVRLLDPYLTLTSAEMALTYMDDGPLILDAFGW